MVLRDLVNLGFLPEGPQRLIETHDWYVYTIVHRWCSYMLLEFCSLCYEPISRNQKRRGRHQGEPS